jgi:hypothetical protein
LFVSKDYSATGVLGLFADIVGSIFSFAENAVGITTGIVLALGSEAGQLLGQLGEEQRLASLAESLCSDSRAG